MIEEPRVREEPDGEAPRGLDEILDVALRVAFGSRRPGRSLEGTRRVPATPRSAARPRLPGRYELVREIGHGGLGTVYEVLDHDLDRELALKSLRPDLRDDHAMARRLVEEARITGQLQHPGIVPVHDLGRCEDHQPYFTMKLVRGRTLASLLDGREDPVRECPHCLEIFERVTQAVAYAHDRGVVHRDLKPANIMVGAFSEVLVMDWGLAKVLDLEDAGDPSVPGGRIHGRPGRGESRAGTVFGTVSYMAPEQARGETRELDERVDVFGLGAILCEILTGAPPHVDADEAELRRRTRVGDTAGISERLERSGAGPELVDLVLQCIEPRREKRLRDAGDVARRIRDWSPRARSCES